MKKNLLKVILSVNALVWIIVSAINYIGIMLQLKEDIMSIFLWSIFTIMMYGLVVYAISMLITRLFMIYQFRDNKVKYFNRKVLLKQLLLLTFVITYLYGACYYNSHLLGLLPMLLFFGKMLIHIGRFYVYTDGRLLMFDDRSIEYLVQDINLGEEKIERQEFNTRNLTIKEVQFTMHFQEKKFLAGIIAKEEDQKDVA